MFEYVWKFMCIRVIYSGHLVNLMGWKLYTRGYFANIAFSFKINSYIYLPFFPLDL